MSDRAVAAITVGSGLFVAITASVKLLRRRRRHARIESEGQAKERASAALAGFRPLAAVVGADGAAALVSGSGPDERGRLALVHVSGRRLVARDIDWSAVRATPAGVVIETGEHRIGGIPLAGIDALDVRRLAPAASEEAVRIAEKLGA